MKKIIALAVASAFVAPAMAADISVSGGLTYAYIQSDKTGTGDILTADDNQVVFTATSETSNGYSVSGKFTVVDDATGETDHQGTALTISGPFGTLGLGDNSGALDATGDYTDMAYWFGGYNMDGNDMAIAYTLPTAVEGLTIRASMSPEGDNYIVGGESSADVAGTDEGLEATAVSVTYSVGDISVYYGEEEVDRAAGQTTTNKSYGIKYSAGAITVAAESGSTDNSAAVTDSDIAAGDDVEYKGLAASYQMGDITLAYEMQQMEEKNVAAQRWIDENTFSVSTDLGGGLSAGVATTSNDSTDSDKKFDRTAVVVKYAF
jgi:predicted porin